MSLRVYDVYDDVCCRLLQMAAAEGLCVEMENGSSKPFVYIVKDTKEVR